MDQQHYFQRQSRQRPDATTNDGLGTGSSAFATIQNAANVIKSFMDCQGFQPHIQVAAETFSESVSLDGTPTLGVNNLQILGTSGSPDSTVWQPAAGNGAIALNSTDWATVVVNGFKFQANGAYTGQTALQANRGIVGFENVDFGAFSGGFHIQISEGGSISWEGTYEVSGSMAYHLSINGGGSANLVTAGNVSVPNALTLKLREMNDER